ncbi:MAG: hypothetical protein ACRDHP_20040 [Ktedonobacterales bacterium]
MRAALKWGIVTGVGAYVVAQLVLTLGATLIFGAGPGDLNHPGILLSGCLGIFFILFAFSAAGYFTGRDTLKAGMGAIGGIIAFVAYALLSRIYTPQTVSTTPAPSASAPAISPVAAGGAFLAAMLVVLGIAALMGWLGGRPGATNARKRLGRAIIENSAEHSGA